MGDSFALVRGVMLVPFTLRTVWQLPVITPLPVTPLTLTIIWLEEILSEKPRVVF
jgi:hypothetical protein